MDKFLKLPIDRIGDYEISQESFKPTQLKESTHRRLLIAKHEFPYKPTYLIIEKALEMYYANTEVVSQRYNGLLLDVVNLQDADQED